MENIIVVLFEVESEAYQGFSELKSFDKTENTDILQGVLVQKTDGVVRVIDSFDALGKATDKMLTGGLIGSVVGILGGPLGVLFGASLGALIGSNSGMADSAAELTLVEMVSEKLEDGEVAIIALINEESEDKTDAYLQKFKVQVRRWTAETVEEEVEDAIEIQKDLYRQSKSMLRSKKNKKIK